MSCHRTSVAIFLFSHTSGYGKFLFILTNDVIKGKKACVVENVYEQGTVVCSLGSGYYITSTRKLSMPDKL